MTDPVNAWSHLARSADGVPIPVHSAGDHRSGFQITLIDPHRQLFLMQTQRCSICGHKLIDGLGVVVVPIRNIETSPIRRDLTLDEISDGVIQISSAKHRVLGIGVDEGEAHVECVARGATMCPYLASGGHHYKSELPDFPHGYGFSDAEIREAQGISQSELDDLLGETRGRVGRPSGRKFTTPPSKIEPDRHGRAHLIASLILPRELVEVTPPASTDDLFPNVDLADPVPATLTDLSIAEVMAVQDYVSKRTQQRLSRNAPCPCGSDLKAKHCHRQGLVPEALIEDLQASPVWGSRS